MAEGRGIADVVKTLREVVALLRDLAVVVLIAVPLVCPECAVRFVRNVRVVMRNAGVAKATILGVEVTAVEEAALSTQIASELLQQVKSTPALSPVARERAVNKALELVSSASARLQSAEASAIRTGSISDSAAWVAVVGADRDLLGAKTELDRTKQAGFTEAFIVLREGWYRTVIPFRARVEADASLSSVRQRIRPGAYLREFGVWCRDQERVEDGVVRCGTAG